MRARRHCPRILRPIVCAAALVAGWLGSSAANPQSSRAADGLPEPICWRQSSFSIPFKVAPVDSPDQQPAEVRLYVSANQGVQWEMAQRVSPQEHSFTFRAPHDGEYWFQIRTADKQGHVASEVAGKPELRVIVDTMKPRLDLTAARGEAGEVKASWQAVDPLLNPDSFKIEYQTSSGSWRPVAVDRQPTGQNRSTTTGTLTWYPIDAPAGSVAVRAEISDQAGNVTQSQAQANLPGVGSQRDLTARSGSAPQPPSDRNWMSTPSPGWSASPATPSSAMPNTAPPSNNVAPSKTAALPPNFAPRSSLPLQRQLAGDPGATPWPTDRSADQPLGRNPIPSDDTSNMPGYSNGPNLNASSDPRSAPDRSGFANTQSPYVTSQFSSANNQSPYASSQDRYGDVASRTVENVNPPIRNQMPPDNNFARNSGPSATRFSEYSPSSNPALSIPSSPSAADSGRSSLSGTPSTGGMLPPGERPLMVNSKSFDLDYEVDGVGPSGIARVELWGTRDGGRTWSSYGIDNDNRSPIRANVDGEGLYGFRIVVQSGNGLGGLPPHSGDAPDLWVSVDLTKPVVRLVDATAGDGPHSGELLIRWEASDAALATRPITLLFSDRPGGQWSIIAAGLENTGQYAWRLDSRAPDRIYLRIEARDEAGNIGVFEAAQPVTLDRIRPEGHIRSVRPSGDTAALSTTLGR
jgi:hypothetical protein